MSARIDLTGQRFSRLVALSVSGLARKNLLWRCLCNCGNHHDVSSDHLRRGLVKSCGCLKAEKLSKGNLIHGDSPKGKKYSREYSSWAHMKTRCTNTKNDNYKYYGGRGVGFCERWKSYKNFLADMGRCPEGMTLERKNVNGNYEPSNCKWATWEEQRANKRNSIKEKITW